MIQTPSIPQFYSKIAEILNIMNYIYISAN